MALYERVSIRDVLMAKTSPIRHFVRLDAAKKLYKPTDIGLKVSMRICLLLNGEIKLTELIILVN
jgi:hypothetical protein